MLYGSDKCYFFFRLPEELKGLFQLDDDGMVDWDQPMKDIGNDKKLKKLFRDWVEVQRRHWHHFHYGKQMPECLWYSKLPAFTKAMAKYNEDFPAEKKTASSFKTQIGNKGKSQFVKDFKGG